VIAMHKSQPRLSMLDEGLPTSAASPRVARSDWTQDAGASPVGALHSRLERELSRTSAPRRLPLAAGLGLSLGGSAVMWLVIWKAAASLLG